MSDAARLVVAGAVLWALAASGAPGEFREVEKGVFVEDFERGGPDQFAPDPKERQRDAPPERARDRHPWGQAGASPPGPVPDPAQ